MSERRCKQCGREITPCTIQTVEGDHCDGWIHVNGGHFCMDENGNASEFRARPAGDCTEPAKGETR